MWLVRTEVQLRDARHCSAKRAEGRGGGFWRIIGIFIIIIILLVFQEFFGSVSDGVSGL